MQDTEDFIDTLPQDEKAIMKRLRGLIFQGDPRISEKLSYGVPYYSLNRRLFFLWPASAIPGYLKKRDPNLKVSLGFCYGNLLSNAQGLLVSEGRKQVYTIPFNTLSEIDDGSIAEILNEAVLMDQQFFGKKNSK